VVDDGKEHIELCHGIALKTPHEDWVPIVRIGRPKEHLFPVQWLLKSGCPEHQTMLDDARRELDFYLVDLVNPDPWEYAQYHCTTAANAYSSIHWSYFPHGRVGKNG